MKIRELVQNPWFWLVAVVLIAIAYAIYDMETKGGKVSAGTKNLETTVTDAYGNVSTTTYQFNPRPYTDRLKETINSWAFGLSDAKPYHDLLALKNSEIVAVAQDWNDRFFREKQETLLQAINGEWLGDDLLARINQKFASLNIS